LAEQKVRLSDVVIMRKTLWIGPRGLGFASLPVLCHYSTG